MNLQTFLNKFTNNDFLLTVDGWCEEMPFCEYETEKNKDYWIKYKNRIIKSYSIILTNGNPELCIMLK